MKKLIIGLFVVVLLATVFQIFFTPNSKNLEGGFVELDFVRNENNTGPVHRAYVYSISDTLWSQIKRHVSLLPHSKYGTTEVFYFLPNTYEGEILLENNKVVLSENSLNNCILYAIQDGMGNIKTQRYPYQIN